MTITISHETEERLRKRAQAEGLSVEAYVEQLVREDEDWGELSEGPLTQHDPEFAEVQARVMEGLEQAKRGEGRPAEDVFAELRAKHGISR
jgi:predicted transcriptional regulator